MNMESWFKNLQCECNQKFTEESLQATIYIYGVFFLEGAKDSFVGTNCPSCLKTICLNVGKTEFEEIISWFQDRDPYIGAHFFEPLGYFTQFGGVPHLHFLCNQSYWDSIQPQESWDSIEERLNDYEEGQADFTDKNGKHLPLKNLYRTYLYNFKDAFSENIGVYWFTKNEVKIALEKEQKEGQKCFPRYLHKHNFLEKLDDFYDKYLLVDELEKTEKREREELKQKIMDLELDPRKAALREFNEPTYPFTNEVGKSEHISLNDDGLGDTYLLFEQPPLSEIIRGLQGNVGDSTPIESFRTILTDSSPFISPHISSSRNMPASIIHTMEAFLLKKRPSLGIINDLKIQQKIAELKRDFYKNNSIEYLSSTYETFINACIQKFQNSTFSPFDLFELRQDFFFSYCEHLEVGRCRETRYAFLKVGSSWEIIFDGESSGLLKGEKGLRYLYELIRNQNNPVPSVELDSIFAEPAQNTAKTLSKEDFNNPEFIKPQETFSSQPTVDQKYYKECEQRLKNLRDEREEAEENQDLAQLERINKETKFIEDALRSTGKKHGWKNSYADNLPVFKDKDNIKIIDRVGKTLSRTINNLKNINAELFEHFVNSINPKKSRELCYKPYEKIDWSLHR